MTIVWDRVEVYKDSIGEYRWTAYSTDGQMLPSEQGHPNKEDALATANRFGVPVIVDGEDTE